MDLEILKMLCLYKWDTNLSSLVLDKCDCRLLVFLSSINSHIGTPGSIGCCQRVNIPNKSIKEGVIVISAGAVALFFSSSYKRKKNIRSGDLVDSQHICSHI